MNASPTIGDQSMIFLFKPSMVSCSPSQRSVQGVLKKKFGTICKKYFPGSASEDSFLFPLSSKLFHYFLCTISLLMDRIASCKNTHKINFDFPGFLQNPVKDKLCLPPHRKLAFNWSIELVNFWEHDNPRFCVSS